MMIFISICELINKYLEKISENNITNPIIVLDDYDDIYLDYSEIMNENIVYNLSKYNNSKFIICGNEKFINKLMINYLSKND